jgi:hypothetical protein
MKRIVIFSMGMLIWSTACLYAQQPAADAACTNATLTGSYGVSVIGAAPATSVLASFPGGLFPVGTVEQILGVVVHTFDGNGKFTQVDNVKGYLSGVTADRPGSGTYSVNPDCSGTYSIFIPGLSFPVVVVRFVIVDGGKEFRGVVVTPQEAMTVANGRKMN